MLRPLEVAKFTDSGWPVPDQKTILFIFELWGAEAKNCWKSDADGGLARLDRPFPVSVGTASAQHVSWSRSGLCARDKQTYHQRRSIGLAEIT